MEAIKTESLRGYFKHATGWGIAAGIGLVLAGLLALVSPVSGALMASLMLGWIAIGAGALELVDAWRRRHEKHGRVWRFVLGAAYLAVGFYVVSNPARGMAALAFALGLGLVLRAGALLFWALDMRPEKHWGLVLFDAIISGVLGVLVLAAWPAGSIIYLGLYVGASLLFNGLERIVIAASVRRHLPPEAPTAPPLGASHA